MIPRWASRCFFTTFAGESVSLKEVLESEEAFESVDFSKTGHLYPRKGSSAKINHDALLLALSSETYPTVIEATAKKLKKALNDRI